MSCRVVTKLARAIIEGFIKNNKIIKVKLEIKKTMSIFVKLAQHSLFTSAEH